MKYFVGTNFDILSIINPEELGIIDVFLNSIPFSIMLG